MKKQIVDLTRTKATVRELELDDIADVIDLFNSIKEDIGGSLDIATLVTKYRSVLTKLDDIVSFEDGSEVTTCGKLSVSEIQKLVPAIKEVNSSFLDILAAQGLDLNLLAEEWEKSKI